MEQHPEAGGLATVTRADGYAVVVEWAETNWSAYAPDVPGCVSTGDTADEAVANMRAALAFHFEGLHEYGEPIPEARTLAITVVPDIAGLAGGGAASDTEATGASEPDPEDPPAASGGVRRRRSAITDARRMGRDASAVLGSLSAAADASRILDSLGGASASEAFAPSTSAVDIVVSANLSDMPSRIDLSAFGGAALGIKSIAASLNEFGAVQLPKIDIASFFASPSLAETMRDFTQVRWSEHRVAMETPLAKILADSPMQHMINAYATDSMIEMSRLVAEIALQSSTIQDTSVYLVSSDRERKVFIVAEHQPDDEDTFTGVEEGEVPDNLLVFGQWHARRRRMLG